jgi:superfamily II DNA/RNA helicase
MALMLTVFILQGYATQVLHGGKAQEEREGALADFKQGGSDILVVLKLL